MVVTPIKHAADKKTTMGATITGLDLNNISNEDLEALREAVHRFQYVTIKDQRDLDPVKHWELVTRLDPTAPQVHGHGTVKEFSKVGGLLSVGTMLLPSCEILILCRNELFMGSLRPLMFALLERDTKARTITASKTLQLLELATIIINILPQMRHLLQAIRSSRDGIVRNIPAPHHITHQFFKCLATEYTFRISFMHAFSKERMLTGTSGRTPL
jgi:hypothetical protein